MTNVVLIHVHCSARTINPREMFLILILILISRLSDQVPDLKEKCLLTNVSEKLPCSRSSLSFFFQDIKDYWYVSQGKLTVPSIDDKEDMQFADEAFDILGKFI